MIRIKKKLDPTLSEWCESTPCQSGSETLVKIKMIYLLCTSGSFQEKKKKKLLGTDPHLYGKHCESGNAQEPEEIILVFDFSTFLISGDYFFSLIPVPEIEKQSAEYSNKYQNI